MRYFLCLIGAVLIGMAVYVSDPLELPEWRFETPVAMTEEKPHSQSMVAQLAEASLAMRRNLEPQSRGESLPEPQPGKLFSGNP